MSFRSTFDVPDDRAFCRVIVSFAFIRLIRGPFSFALMNQEIVEQEKYVRSAERT